MSREHFLNALDYFDEHFNEITDEILYSRRMCAEPNSSDRDFRQSFSQLLDEQNKKHGREKDSLFQGFNRIDLIEVKEITSRVGNCFEYFYDDKKGKVLSDGELHLLFAELSKIELGLLYFERFSRNYRYLRDQNKHKTMQNRIDNVLEFAESIGRSIDESVINGLKDLHSSLDNKHFTERQLFEDLLINVAVLLNEGKQGRKVINATNSLIKEYFQIDHFGKFSRQTNIDKFIEVTYYYTDAKGITLSHSPRIGNHDQQYYI